MADAAKISLNPGDARIGMLAARAILLHELLCATPEPAELPISKALRQRWQAALGPVGLARRLVWRAADRSSPPVATLPARWEALLAAALANPAATSPPACLDPAAPIPYEEVLLPFLAAARPELEREAGEALTLFAGPARAGLERALLALLSRIALTVLSSEFALRQALDGRCSWLETARPIGDYRAFVTAMQAGDFRLLLQEYPGLARLLALAALGWAQAHGQLMARLRMDWPDLCASFGFADADCRVEALATYCSDPHDGGQSVAILLLPGGRFLVYKPRPLDMEQGLQELLGWANGAGFPWPFRVVDLLGRHRYGWMEHVAAAPCTDAASVTRFYARSGALFCLWWLLQGTDIHHENLIASGEQPVISMPKPCCTRTPFPALGAA